MAARFEKARDHLGVKNHAEMSREVWPGDEKRRTRYETVLRTLRTGKRFPTWDTIEPIVSYFVAQGFVLEWLLYGRGPWTELERRRLASRERIPDESGERPTVSEPIEKRTR